MTKNKKLLYLSASEFPSRKANSVHVVKMCSAFSKFFNVELVAKKSRAETGADIASVFDFDGEFRVALLGGAFGRVGFLVMLLGKLIFGGHDYCYGRHAISVALATLLRKVSFYESHAIPANKFIVFLEKYLIKAHCCKRFIVISQALKADYLSKYPDVSQSFFVVAHDGADPVSSGEPDMRPNKSTLRVGYVGHLYSGRGIEKVVFLAKHFKDIEFVVVGGDEKDVFLWRQKCGDLANIQFVGYVPHKKLDQYYRTFDLVLAPYQDSPNQAAGEVNTTRWMSPMKIFEYMSYGLAMVVSDHPVLREVLDDESCLFVNPTDIESWIKAVGKLKNSSLRQSLGVAAHARFMDRFTWVCRAEYLSSAMNDS